MQQLRYLWCCEYRCQHVACVADNERGKAADLEKAANEVETLGVLGQFSSGQVYIFNPIHNMGARIKSSNLDRGRHWTW